MYPFSRCTKCSRSGFSHSTTCRRSPSTPFHLSAFRSIAVWGFWFFGGCFFVLVSGFVVVFWGCFWGGFCQMQSQNTKFQCWEMMRASQSIPFTHQMGSPEVLDTASHTRPNPAPPPALGLRQQVSPASCIVFAFQRSQAKRPSFPHGQ